MTKVEKALEAAFLVLGVIVDLWGSEGPEGGMQGSDISTTESYLQAAPLLPIEITTWQLSVISTIIKSRLKSNQFETMSRPNYQRAVLILDHGNGGLVGRQITKPMGFLFLPVQ